MLRFNLSLIVLRRLLLLLPLLIPAIPGEPAWAERSKQTLCCRVAGGTRNGCLGDWSHLVPKNNRINPGVPSQIAFLQGPSAEPTGMILRLFTPEHQLIHETVLESRSVGVTLLTLPPVTSPMILESHPSCSPESPSARSLLDPQLPIGDNATIRMTQSLRRSCGASIATSDLLAAFQLESLEDKLPATLPVHCGEVTQ